MKDIAAKASALALLAAIGLSAVVCAQTERQVKTQVAKARALNPVALSKRAEAIGSTYLRSYEARTRAADLNVRVNGVSFKNFYDASIKDKELAFWRTLEEGRRQIAKDPAGARRTLNRAADLARQIEALAQPYVAEAKTEDEARKETEEINVPHRTAPRN